MRIFGNKNRDEVVLDPIEALRRGAAQDKQIKNSVAATCTWRLAGHASVFNCMDDARATEMAQRVNRASRVYPTTFG